MEEDKKMRNSLIIKPYYIPPFTILHPVTYMEEENKRRNDEKTKKQLPSPQCHHYLSSIQKE